MKQIFQDKTLQKKYKWLINLYIQKAGLSFINFKRVIRKFDSKRLLIRNYCYFFKLNKSKTKIKSKNLLLLEVLLAQCFQSEWSSEDIIKADAFKQHFHNEINQNIKNSHQDLVNNLFKQANTQKGPTLKDILESNVWFMGIGEMFYQAFKREKNSQLYYDYGYLWAVLLVINMKIYLCHKTLTADLLKFKLMVTQKYIETLSVITPLHFNDFIIQNNFYLHKIKRYYSKRK